MNTSTATATPTGLDVCCARAANKPTHCPQCDEWRARLEPDRERQRAEGIEPAPYLPFSTRARWQSHGAPNDCFWGARARELYTHTCRSCATVLFVETVRVRKYRAVKKEVCSVCGRGPFAVTMMKKHQATTACQEAGPEHDAKRRGLAAVPVWLQEWVPVEVVPVVRVKCHEHELFAPAWALTFYNLVWSCSYQVHPNKPIGTVPYALDERDAYIDRFMRLAASRPAWREAVFAARALFTESTVEAPDLAVATFMQETSAYAEP